LLSGGDLVIALRNAKVAPTRRQQHVEHPDGCEVSAVAGVEEDDTDERQVEGRYRAERYDAKPSPKDSISRSRAARRGKPEKIAKKRESN
jgi:hypothetical protein